MPVERAEYNNLRVKAMSAVAAAINKGELKPANELKCVDCQSDAAQYDHRDYYKPLDVVPVCRSCNKQRGSGYPHTYPPKKSKARKNIVFVRLSDEEHASIVRAAKMENRTKSTFTRLAAVARAKRTGGRKRAAR